MDYNMQTSNNQQFSMEASNIEWNKLSKFVQWKLFKAYMHEHNIQNGDYFKRMKSLVSEKRTIGVITYDPFNKKVIAVDFKHENFIRERSKKKKLQQAIASAKAELPEEEFEVVEEEVVILCDQNEQLSC
jgi:aryl-alcohol dehydrogenase-like predicted oxidoreductase